MQGTFRDITIYDLLQVIEMGQCTGTLWIESGTHDSPGIPEDSSWQLALVGGRILHGAPVEKWEERIQDYLHRLNVDADLLSADGVSGDVLSGDMVTDVGSQNHALNIESAIQDPPMPHPEYLLLGSLLEQKKLNLRQGQALLKRLIEETLFDALPLCTGTFHLTSHRQISDGIAPFLVSPRLLHLQRELQAWKQLYPLVKVPAQCPIVSDAKGLRNQLTGAAFRNLTEWADGHLSIRRLARRLNRSDLTVAQAIYPYLERGLMQLRAPTSR